MGTRSHDFAIDSEQLRKRLPQQSSIPQQAGSTEAARKAVKSLNDARNGAENDDRAKRTYGRTPNGTGAYSKIFWSVLLGQLA